MLNLVKSSIIIKITTVFLQLQKNVEKSSPNAYLPQSVYS